MKNEFERWEKNVRLPSLKKMPKNKANFKTLSGYSVDSLYTPLDLEGIDYLRDIGFPGEYPYTRGRLPNGFRSFKWPHDFYSGFGSSESANKRYRELVEHGANVITIALDLPTQIGIDSNHPLADGEVGKAGVAMASIVDAERVLKGIDLAKVGLGFVANSIGPYALSIALALCEKQGLDPAFIRHFRIQNDPLKEYTGRGTYIFPVKIAIELATDVVEYICKNYHDKWYWQWVPQYVCTTQMRWGGLNAAQEIGFGFANFFSYIESALGRGISLETFLPKMELHATADLDLFEEVAKFRAARRLWANLIKERYGCENPNLLGLRITVYTAGNRMTAQQPLNNISRIAMQVLAAILGGVEHIWAPAYDEALALPTSESTRISNQIKFILHHECGLENVTDPMGGSYYLEKLTTQIEEEAKYWLEKIENEGGVANVAEGGFYYKEQLKMLYSHQKEIDEGERKVVGINLFESVDEAPMHIFEVDPGDKEVQLHRLENLIMTRNSSEVKLRLETLGEAALRKAVDKKYNIIPSMLEAVKAYATVGEIFNVLREAFGEFKGSNEIL